MARYRGPDSKLIRNAGVSETEIPKGAKLKRKYPTGQHGQERKKISEYATQLREKQKIKLTYGLLEKQFRKIVDIAHHKKGVTGTIVLQTLETRFDNVVFRAGLAKTRRQARQLVNHDHYLINGKPVNIPSYKMKVGDIITVREKSKANVKALIEGAQPMAPRWVESDLVNLSARFVQMPEREDIDRNFNEQLIIEYYSR